MNNIVKSPRKYFNQETIENWFTAIGICTLVALPVAGAFVGIKDKLDDNSFYSIENKSSSDRSMSAPTLKMDR